MIINEGFYPKYVFNENEEYIEDIVHSYVEASMKDQKRFFEINPLNYDLFIERNELPKITNPIFFASNGNPTSDGLLSNEIFGITMDDRSNQFAYIELGGEWFLHPLFYNVLKILDRGIVKCIHGVSNFVIDKDGYLVESEEGNTGLSFLKDNFDRIKFKRTESSTRDYDIEFIDRFKKYAFIKNFLVIPPYYRDVLSTERYIGVGDINKLYAQLIMATKSLVELDKYGISLYDANKGRIQEIINDIFEYFTKGTINKEKAGMGISGKLGLLRYAGQSKTTDYASRMVIVAPNLKVESIEDLIVDEDHAALPLSSVITNFYPYMLSYIRKFFENEYLNKSIRTIYIGKGKEVKVKLKDVRIAFSDDKLIEEMDRFVHGVADRFRPIKLPTEDRKYPFVKIRFKGRYVTKDEIMDPSKISQETKAGIVERDMTWCDLFYIAAIDITNDKYTLITRYPIDSCYNQFSIGINVNSTIKTEPLIVDGKFYRWYPVIKQEDIGKNTTSTFVDTCMLPDTALEFIRGDYKLLR